MSLLNHPRFTVYQAILFTRHVHQSHRALCGLPLHLLQSCCRSMPHVRAPRPCGQHQGSPRGLHLFTPFTHSLPALNLSAFLSRLGLWEWRHHLQLSRLVAQVRNGNPPEGVWSRPRTTLIPKRTLEGSKDGSMRRGYRQVSLGPRALCLKLGPEIL